MTKILLACGTGASSGFVAQSMRKAAKKQGLEVSIKATSDTDIMEYVNDIDILLIGPHLKHRYEEIESSVKDYGVKSMIISKDHYAILDGKSVLEEALELIK